MGLRRLVGRRRARALVAAATAVVLLGGCAQIVNGTGTAGAVPDAKLGVIGVSDSDFDRVTQNALADVQAFWKVQYPKISGGKALPPLTGGLYSVDGLQVLQSGEVPNEVQKEKCVAQQPKFIVDNGAYCRLDDSIIWDRSPDHLLPQLQRKYGDLLVALIFAHEFGHAISERAGVFGKDLPTIDTESQADCAAGAFAASVLAGQAPHFRGMQGQFDQALEGFLNARDSTPSDSSDISHGNGFDRLSAIAVGIDRGATYCYSSSYFDRTFTERPFATDDDLAQNGNESLAQVLDPTPTDPQTGAGGGGLQPDLNRFWKAAAESINKSWTDVKIAAADHPKCGATPTSEFGYCPDDNTVYYSNSIAHDAYYSLPDIAVDPQTGNVRLLFNQPADFALGTLFAMGWGLAVRHQLFARSTDDKAALLAAACYTGAYAKDINIEASSTPRFLLSPPDLDEASSALLTLVGDDRTFGARGTSGLDRIQSFVKGYGGGLSVC
jgi:predicted metalloprotease